MESNFALIQMVACYKTDVADFPNTYRDELFLFIMDELTQ